VQGHPRGLSGLKLALPAWRKASLGSEGEPCQPSPLVDRQPTTD